MTIGRVSVFRATNLALVFAMTAFQVYAVLFGAPQPFVFRSTDPGFALILIFLLFPALSNVSRSAQVLGLLFIAASLAMIGYLISDQETLYMRVQLIDPPSRSQFWPAVTLTFLVLETCRRTLGPALPPTAVAFILSAVGTGKLTPGFTADVMYLTIEGIFGIPLTVSATYLVLFGALAEHLGTGRFLSEFASAIAGGTTGDPLPVSSLRFDLGNRRGQHHDHRELDDPAIKRLGYRPAFAGSVEPVSSTGGQIMPPGMGAAAFVMAEFISVAYLDVMLIALIPATLSFVSVFLAIYFDAKRQALSGLEDQPPRVSTVLWDRGHQIIPFFVIIATMFGGYSSADNAGPHFAKRVADPCIDQCRRDAGGGTSPHVLLCDHVGHPTARAH